MWFQKRGKIKSAYGHSSLIGHLAARAGSWIAGLAAELAQVSEESLTPSDVADALWKAFCDLRNV